MHDEEISDGDASGNAGESSESDEAFLITGGEFENIDATAEHAFFLFSASAKHVVLAVAALTEIDHDV